MPRFLCYCPDYPDALELRLSVRARHLEDSDRDKEAGRQTDGSAFLAIPGSEAASRTVPEGQPNLTGSFMIYNLETIDQVWDRIRKDAYWENNVWDREKLTVWPLRA
ncbi:hypothetical protein BD324DRAFT_647938 [Kockovaella imperatae]|uniref:YCII-related domain-containing protein n=1 Tax=Kockovaella imperatae TaxID=4999 RepID=A0A1Y1USQ5_9TREE|nr:hypothetical protein BD324DRAFT_647938 [Kockovaella imperatae]ORX41041.1 hypothetical protein BD324DRAFT_647938 [Kockovaella imperatae]